MNKTKIYFIENSFDYNGLDLNSENIGGSEKTLINITNELAVDKRFTIKVFNNTTKPDLINKVTWTNINQINSEDKPDYVIAMSDANLFKKLNSNKNFLWSHSIQSLEKFIRKKQFIPFMKFKPIMILEGDYHYNKRSFLTSIFGKKILKIAPDYDFINTEVDINYIPPPNAIFTTKSDRNLEILLSSWHEIKKKNKESKLFINPPYKLNDLQKKDDVYLRLKGNKKTLINELKESKLFITPGHKTEVFCLAAEEARELCLPIVTMGYGCLYERVIHEETGFIAKNIEEFVYYSNLVLSNNEIFTNLRKNLFKRRNARNYSQVKNDLIELLKVND